MKGIELVDSILNAVLPVYQSDLPRETIIVYQPARDSNPARGQENLGEVVVAIKNKIEHVQSVQAEMAKKVEEVHAVHTGKYFKDTQKEKPLTKRQREKLEIEEMKNFALNKALNRAK